MGSAILEGVVRRRMVGGVIKWGVERRGIGALDMGWMVLVRGGGRRWTYIQGDGREGDK